MPVSIIRKFLRLEASSGIILFLMALFAIIFVNSPYAHVYHSLLQMPLAIHLGGFSLAEPLLFWVNEGLMTIFFLLVGLELKREFVEGELSGSSKIVLPGVAALGGMIIPALFYVLINYNTEITVKGWAIPMATDIAFALGVLSLFSQRVPLGVKLFLMALSIFDDIGAIIIIAVFYSHSITPLYLLFSFIIVVLLWLLNRIYRVQRLFPYLILGILLWACVLHSGVHASIAGVVLSMMIPLRRYPQKKISPLHYLEDALHPWVAYLVMPLFAFTNAGLSFNGVSWSTLSSPMVLGIVAGLFLGKQLGVFAFVWLMIKCGLAKLPEQASWFGMYGVAVVCGVGFTMSLFLGTLAFQFEQAIYLTEVRLGVLLGSVLSGLTGAMILHFAFVKKRRAQYRA